MTKKQAMADAKWCRAKLDKPERWQLAVCKLPTALDWYWCLHSGPITIWPADQRGRYVALLAEAVPPAGRRYPGSHQWGSGPRASKDPNKLVRAYLKDARHHIDTAQQVEKWLTAL